MNPRTLEDDNADVDLKDVETLDSPRRVLASHYEPTTDEEKALDKRVNLKLDFIVLSLLAIEFIVRLSRPLPTNAGSLQTYTECSSAVSTRLMLGLWRRAPFRKMRISPLMIFPTLYPWYVDYC